MRVTFAAINPKIASSRLRAEIPQEALKKLGVGKGMDILVYGKHVVSTEVAGRYSLRVYDVCDNHFYTLHEKYYREHCKLADLVTVNSESMREIVKEETGRDAVVIPDPYESEEREAGFGEGVFWFGHQSNIKTIEPYMDCIDYILTGDDWTREKQLLLLELCGVVVIPTDNRAGKSANRLIEAVRNGRFVVAGELPAHDEFKEYMWIGDIREGLEWAKAHTAECIERVRKCQDYIRDKYSPERIGKMWFEALEQLWQSRITQNLKRQ